MKTSKPRQREESAVGSAKMGCEAVWQNMLPVSDSWNPSLCLCCRRNNQLRGLCTAAVPGRVLNSHEIKAFLML